MTMRFDPVLRWSLALVAVGCVACSKKGSSTESGGCGSGFPTEVDAAIQAALAAHPDTAGAVVAIYHPDHGYMHKAYGLENRASGTAMRADHVFDIGSVMKSFRWVVIHKLAAQGSLSLSDAVNDHVASPALPGRTLKHLMQHSTGLIDINDSTYMADAMANPTRTYAYAEMIAFLTGSSGAGYTNGLTDTFTVGTSHRYSSFGPLIAGQVAEAVTGTGMMDLIDEMVLSPLGLANTSFMSYDAKPANVAQGYDDATTEMNDMDDEADTRAFSSGFGGLMYSSACDLARYANNQFNNDSFLPSAIVEAMTSETVASGSIQVGLGVFKYPQWGDFWGHLGSSIHGHSSAMAHRKSDKLSVVVLANIDDAHDDYATHFAVISAVGDAF